MEVLLAAIETQHTESSAPSISFFDSRPSSPLHTHAASASTSLPSTAPASPLRDPKGSTRSSDNFASLSIAERASIVQEIWKSEAILELCNLNKLINEALLKKRKATEEPSTSFHHHIKLEAIIEYYGIKQSVTIEKVRFLHRRYEEEMEKLEDIASQFLLSFVKSFTGDTTLYLMSPSEMQSKQASIQRLFDHARSTLNVKLITEVSYIADPKIVATINLPGDSTLTEIQRRPMGDEKNPAVLNSWYEAHFNDPYPSEGDKELLSFHSGFTIRQLNVWFANKRARDQRRKPSFKVAKTGVPTSSSVKKISRRSQSLSDTSYPLLVEGMNIEDAFEINEDFNQSISL